MLVVGLALFAAGAFAASAADGPETITALRGLSGVGAALVMPTTLSVITRSFPAEERSRAVGAWIVVAGAGAVFGLLTSDLLLEWFSWASVLVFGGMLATSTLTAAVAVPPARATAARRASTRSGACSPRWVSRASSSAPSRARTVAGPTPSP